MVPAYTFTRFLELPRELQLRIWFLAARLEEARDILLLRETEQLHPEATRVDFLQRREDESEFETPYPVMLGLVCKDARAAALQVYAPVAWKDGSRHFFNYFKVTHGYANILYDCFHIYGGYSENYRLFMNMMHAHHGRIQLDQTALDNINFFAKIRILVLNFNLFAHTPTCLWSQFKKLEHLTIVIHPHRTIHHHGSYASDHHSLDRMHPSPSTLFGKRTSWLRSEVTRALRTATTGWELPTIEITHFKNRLGRFTNELDDVALLEDVGEDAQLFGVIQGQDYEVEDGEDENACVRYLKLDHSWYRGARAVLKIAVMDQEDRET